MMYAFINIKLSNMPTIPLIKICMYHIRSLPLET